MRIRKKYIFATIVMLMISGAYALFLFGIPAVLNSDMMIKKYERFLSSKLGTDIKLQGFLIKISPNLSIDIFADKIGAANDILSLKNVEYGTKPLSIKPEKINIEDIYVDFGPVKKEFFAKNKSNDKTSFKLNFFPIININNAYVKLDDKSFVKFQNIKSEKQGAKVICSFQAQLQTSNLDGPVVAGNDGSIYYSDSLNFDNLSVNFKNSKLYLSGALDNLDIKGKDLPVKELETTFLYFYKLRHPNKKNFIENFHNFAGLLDVDLNFSSEGLIGRCTAHNLKADFSKFMIPINLPLVVFNFNTGRDIIAKTNGYFGSEPVYTDFYLSGLATDNVILSGSVKSELTDKFSKKYFKPVQIAGSADAVVKYRTQDGKVSIQYILGLDKGSNLISKYGNLDNIDKYRRIIARTLKQGDTIKLEKYTYEFVENGRRDLLLSGNGSFVKNDGHYKPAEFSVKTNGDVPVDIIKSFTKNFITGGTFAADLKYNFTSKVLDGFMTLKDTYHDDFLHMKSANIIVSKRNIKLISDGTFFNSPITMSVLADNNFKTNILIHYIDIHLDKFYVKRGNISSYSGNSISTENIKKNYNMVVESGKIRVDEIIHSKFYLHDVEIQGKLSNNIVDFTIPETEYAKGILSAVGKYNISNHSSNINFLASDIDSNEVASKIFNLHNHVEGSAFATLHLITKNKLNDIHAHATFAISDGFLPKLGSREFIINKSKKKNKLSFLLKKPFKFTLSKISNIDFSKPNVFYSNLHGSFIVNNDDVKNAKIYSQSDNLSMFIEGNYNIESQYGNLCIWGRHNKIAERKIKIFRIPLSLIYKVLFRVERSRAMYQDKLKMIPPIKAEPQEEALFRVDVCGNLNSNDIKVLMKDIK